MRFHYALNIFDRISCPSCFTKGMTFSRQQAAEAAEAPNAEEAFACCFWGWLTLDISLLWDIGTFIAPHTPQSPMTLAEAEADYSPPTAGGFSGV